ncbi:uncharacterized protein LOC110668592 [Hevea brasiliensis]|uniref:uncharacterized protein LOC110668592 n=1 Tax=Hevea brasiliensis TaxID=3981 RepID=UPI0025EEC703|nr:uncharacterized protein LOC110668592 [Hevea brasiliensis]XP_057992833.1 uncharacterized protein LOC110668592 [Hevea brasiliensis]XP_057992834.1 uncharacterized protein LOC110668592 [Hevea brasiliensis]XP_057992835.1 uncharacterized protein LOC110668592 [Hevea brasiliensis]
MTTQRKNMCVNESYDCNIEEWLIKHNTDARWSSKHHTWNLDPVKASINWNLEWTTLDTVQLVQGMITSVIEFHDKNEIHGYFHNRKNFLLKFGMKCYFRAHVRNIVKIFIVHDDKSEKKNGDLKDKSKNADVTEFASMICHTILGKEMNELPSNWINPTDSVNMLYTTDRHKNVIPVEFVKNHPALWPWRRRLMFYEECWVRAIHATADMYKYNRKRYYIHKWVRNIAINIKFIDWFSNISVDTPMRRLFNDMCGRSRLKTDNGYDLLHFHRVFHHHYCDQDKSQNLIVNRTDSKDYKDRIYGNYNNTVFSIVFCNHIQNIMHV